MVSRDGNNENSLNAQNISFSKTTPQKRKKLKEAYEAEKNIIEAKYQR